MSALCSAEQGPKSYFHSRFHSHTQLIKDYVTWNLILFCSHSGNVYNMVLNQMQIFSSFFFFGTQDLHISPLSVRYRIQRQG